MIPRSCMQAQRNNSHWDVVFPICLSTVAHCFQESGFGNQIPMRRSFQSINIGRHIPIVFFHILKLVTPVLRQLMHYAAVLDIPDNHAQRCKKFSAHYTGGGNRTNIRCQNHKCNQQKDVCDTLYLIGMIWASDNIKAPLPRSDGIYFIGFSVFFFSIIQQISV